MGELYIKTSVKNGKTVVSDRFYTSPFKIAQPFYDRDTAEIMVMQASAGILAGDAHRLQFDIGAGSKVMITGQSYTKLFDMSGKNAKQETRITVAEGAELYYMPCPVIPFCGSDFESRVNIKISRNSRLFLWDIMSCGRVGMGERFAFKRYRQRMEVMVDGRTVFVDNARLVPDECDVSGIGFFEGHTHMGAAYLYGFEKITLPEAQGITAAKTKAAAGQLVRVLGGSGEEIADYLKLIV